MKNYSEKYKINENIETNNGMLYKGDIVIIEGDKDTEILTVTDLTGKIFHIDRKYVDFNSEEK